MFKFNIIWHWSQGPEKRKHTIMVLLPIYIGAMITFFSQWQTLVY